MDLLDHRNITDRLACVWVSCWCWCSSVWWNY